MPQPTIHPAEIAIHDFLYPLPDERIARFPLEERDLSKLLIYEKGRIQEDIYRNLATYLPKDSLLLFNQAKVIHARLYFQKDTGGKLEIFCLEPDNRYPDITTAMMQEGEVYWKCLVKGAAKWKGTQPVFMDATYSDNAGTEIKMSASAEKVKREGNAFIICFRWQLQPGKLCCFSEFLEHVGKLPIPPYLKREAEAMDEVRYQTIFAENEGSVAAPTAALHFTPFVIKQLEKKGINRTKLTLHVGAGTFMPVKSEKMQGHEMHAEWIEVSRLSVEQVLNQIQKKQKIVAVGTTSARTLESLYWIGVQYLRGDWDEKEDVAVEQWYPYQYEDEYSGQEALEALLKYLKEKNIAKLITRTRLIIAPGYEFKLLDGLITNFHQPASTLLLMIAALVGDEWHEIYDYALDNNFRFLSYGDGSLLWKNNCK